MEFNLEEFLERRRIEDKLRQNQKEDTESDNEDNNGDVNGDNNGDVNKDQSGDVNEDQSGDINGDVNEDANRKKEDIITMDNAFEKLVYYHDIIGCSMKLRSEIITTHYEFNRLSTLLLDMECIRKYLFSFRKPLSYSLLELKNDIWFNNIHHIELKKKEMKKVVNKLDKIYELYGTLHYAYYVHYRIIAYAREISKENLKCFSGNNNARGYDLISGNELKVMNILAELRKSYKMWFFYKHKWSFCRNKCVLEYDFYGILIHENDMIHFVIEYDGDYHFKTNEESKKLHICDIIKQYYLRRMGIHLLRLNKKSNIELSIDVFFEKLIRDLLYVSIGALTLRPKMFNDNSVHMGLKYFAKIYTKAKKLKHYSLMIDDIDIFKNFNVVGNGSNEGEGDENVIVI